MSSRPRSELKSFNGGLHLHVEGCFVHIHNQGQDDGKGWRKTVECPTRVINVALAVSHDMSHVIIATRDNCIWQIPISCLEHTKGHREKESHKKDAETKCVMNENVFDDLLAETDDSTRPQAGLVEDMITINNCSHIDTILLELRQLIQCSDFPILDLSVVGDVVILLVDTHGLACVQIFQLRKFDELCSIKDSKRMDLLVEIPTGLDSMLFRDSTTRRFMYVAEADEPCENSSLEGLPCSSRIILPKSLFVSLFGKAAACLKSSVLMLCTTNGSVYSYPLKSTGSSVHQSFNIICQMDSKIVNVLPIEVSCPRPSERVDCQEALSALSQSLQPNTPDLSCQGVMSGLLMCCETGDCCLFVTPQSQLNIPPSLLFSLQQQIISCVVKDDHIVYSTGESVNACKLSVKKESADGAMTVVPNITVLLPRAKIDTLLPFCLRHRCEGLDASVTGLTSDLNAVSIALSPQEERPEFHPTAMEDALRTIRQYSHGFKAAHEKTSEVTAFLQQMNFFASLAHYMKVRNSPVAGKYVLTEKDRLISCSCCVGYHQDGVSEVVSLRVSLRNESSLTLSQDWQVGVTVRNMPDLLITDVAETKVKHFSFPCFQGLEAKSVLEFSVPVHELLKNNRAPSLEVSVSLILCIREHILSKDMKVGHDTKVLKVSVYQQDLDILHFLRIAESGPRSHTTLNTRGSTDHRLLQELSSLASARIALREQKQGSCAHVNHIVTSHIDIPSALVAEGGISQAVDILRFILQDSSIAPSAITTSSCQLEGLSNISVSLLVDQHNESNKSSDSLPRFSVTIRTSDMITLWAVGNAISSKFKMQKKSESVDNISRKDLQKRLLSLEKLRSNMLSANSKLDIHHQNDAEDAQAVCALLDEWRNMCV